MAMTKPQQKNSPNHGFTLVELLVAIAIFSVVLVGLFAMLTSFLKIRNGDQTEQLLATEGNYILDRLEFLVRNGVTMPDVCCTQAVGTGVTKCNGSADVISGINPTPAAMQTRLLEDDAGGQFRRTVLNQVSLFYDAATKITHVQLGTGGNTSSLTNTNLSSDQVQASNLQFHCLVTDVDGAAGAAVGLGSPARSAAVTISFTLTTQRDLLGALPEMSMTFSRQVAVGNNFPYIFDN